MTSGELLAEELDGTRDWTLRLLADFEGDAWGFQAAPGLQHALWICGHLACSQNALLFQRCLKRNEMEPAFTSHFPVGSPIKSVEEHSYPAPAEVRREMDRMQDLSVAAVRGLDEAALAQPAFAGDGSIHPHYRTVRGAIAHISRHEAFHAGQLAMLRRLMGKRFLR